MQLSLFADYGLRAMMLLASNPGRVFTAREIADEFSISRNHLLKIFQTLARAGVVHTTRGIGGGIQLSLPASQLSVGELLRMLEGSDQIVECVGKNGPCLLLQSCGLKGHLEKAKDAFFSSLHGVTLADCLYQPLLLPIDKRGL